MKINILKILFVFFIFISCKNPSVTKITELPKRKNILECTKWKSSATEAFDVDVILDFYTDKDVQEYIVGNDGKEIKSREGTYKVKSKFLKIKWSGVNNLVKTSEGNIKDKSMVLTEQYLHSKTYYKILSY